MLFCSKIKTDTTHINDWINKSNNNECDKSTAQHILRSQSVYKINLKLDVIRKVESNLKKLKSRKQSTKTNLLSHKAPHIKHNGLNHIYITYK